MESIYQYYQDIYRYKIIVVLRNLRPGVKLLFPQEIRLSLKKIKDNDEAVKAYGVELGVKTMQRLLIECKENSIGFRSLHFYTMNLAVAVTQILQGLGMLQKIPNMITLYGTKCEGRCKANFLEATGG